MKRFFVFAAFIVFGGCGDTVKTQIIESCLSEDKNAVLVLGTAKMGELCECVYDSVRKKLSSSELSKVASNERGIADPLFQKYIESYYTGIATCANKMAEKSPTRQAPAKQVTGSDADHNRSGVGESIIAPPQGIVASPPIENIKSDSRSISGAVLGEKIKNHLYGEPLAIDGGPYYFSKNHLHLSYDGRGNNFNGLEEPIANIEFACREGAFGKSKGAVAIDGISCDSDVKEVMNNRDWKKFCYLHSFDPLDKPLPLMLRRNNAYFSIQFDDSSKPYIREMGITLRKVVLGEIYQDCEEAEKMKIIARQKGFKSLGNMMNPNPVEGG
ncbi:MAG: hypothetical protein WCR74_03155 [Betaproteobacteria bacterium]